MKSKYKPLVRINKQKIFQIMRERDISIYKLAQDADLHYRVVWSAFQPEREYVRNRTLRYIAKGLNVCIEDLTL